MIHYHSILTDPAGVIGLDTEDSEKTTTNSEVQVIIVKNEEPYDESVKFTIGPGGGGSVFSSLHFGVHLGQWEHKLLIENTELMELVRALIEDGLVDDQWIRENVAGYFRFVPKWEATSYKMEHQVALNLEAARVLVSIFDKGSSREVSISLNRRFVEWLAESIRFSAGQSRPGQEKPIFPVNIYNRPGLVTFVQKLSRSWPAETPVAA